MLRTHLSLLTCATVLITGCNQSSDSDRLLPDKLRAGPLSLDENTITASLTDNEVTLQVPISLDEGNHDARIEMRSTR